MKLLIGTHNPGKKLDFTRSIEYISAKFQKNIELVFPSDLGIVEDVEETGSTFAENSLLKAEYYFNATGIPTLTDDGGIIIPILNNEPGVHTKRWLGRDATDEELIAYTFKRLAPYPHKEDRRCYFEVCLTYMDEDKTVQETGRTEGYIADKVYMDVPTKGFPFRAIFRVGGKYYEELTQEQHEILNHRDKAIQKLFGTIFT